MSGTLRHQPRAAGGDHEDEYREGSSLSASTSAAQPSALISLRITNLWKLMLSTSGGPLHHPDRQ